jgi:purine catabolism regulator
MEMLRLRAVAEAESRVRGDFLWGLVAGVAGGPAEISANAALLGYDLRLSYEVAVGSIDESDEESRHRRGERIVAQLQAATAGKAIVSRQDGQLLVLLPASETGALRAALAQVQEALADPERPIWGIAGAPTRLVEVAEAFRGATRALEVGRVIYGPGTIADAYSLGPYLMLDVVARDPVAMEAGQALLEPILAYDEQSGRELLATLEVYLRENGNTSSAARILFLNRHSLIYRLRKIETLTGRSLDRYEDRFMLDLSIKLLRLIESRADGEPASSGR